MPAVTVDNLLTLPRLPRLAREQLGTRGESGVHPAFTAMAYVLAGHGYAGTERRPVVDHQLAVFGPGTHIVLRAADVQTGDLDALDVLVLGGMPIREPIALHGPFVMNTRREIEQAIDDFRAGRLGTIPADQIAPRNFA